MADFLTPLLRRSPKPSTRMRFSKWTGASTNARFASEASITSPKTRPSEVIGKENNISETLDDLIAQISCCIEEYQGRLFLSE